LHIGDKMQRNAPPLRKGATFAHSHALAAGRGYSIHSVRKSRIHILDVQAVGDSLSHLIIYFSSQNKNKNDLMCGNFDASTHTGTPPLG
jgi:hypothetical protein